MLTSLSFMNSLHCWMYTARIVLLPTSLDYKLLEDKDLVSEMSNFPHKIKHILTDPLVIQLRDVDAITRKCGKRWDNLDGEIKEVFRKLWNKHQCSGTCLSRSWKVHCGHWSFWAHLLSHPPFCWQQNCDFCSPKHSPSEVVLWSQANEWACFLLYCMTRFRYEDLHVSHLIWANKSQSQD